MPSMLTCVPAKYDASLALLKGYSHEENKNIPKGLSIAQVQ